VLIAVEVFKLLDRLGPEGDMQGRIKDFEELDDKEREFAVVKASSLVQVKLTGRLDHSDPLEEEFVRASGGSGGADAYEAALVALREDT
jgi:hypothetical protein